MRKLLVAGVALAAISGAANASIIPILSSISADGGGVYTYTYSGQLASDQGLTAGDQLDIYNVAGYVSGSATSPYADVTVTSTTGSNGLGLPPGFVVNPADTTVVFTYEGPDYQTTGGPYCCLTNFTFSFESTFANSVEGAYSAVAVKNDGPTPGTTTYNQGSVEVPGAVPEPAAWALLMIGVGMIGGALRRRAVPTLA